jgi:hypothetical protein
MLQFRGWTNQGVLENTIVIHEEEEKEFCSGMVPDVCILRIPIFGFDDDFFSSSVPDLVKQISSRGC